MGFDDTSFEADYILVGIDIVRRRGDRLAVDSHAALLDEILAVAAGGNPAGSQEFGQPFLLASGLALLYRLLDSIT